MIEFIGGFIIGCIITGILIVVMAAIISCGGDTHD